MQQLQVAGKDLRRSLNLVILAVTFGMVFFTVINGSPITGFAKELGAGDFIYGVLMALPVLSGALQIFVSFLLEKTRKRKKLFIIGGLIQRFFWIPAAVVPLVVPESMPALRVWLVIFFITIAATGGAFTNVTFFSWMGQLIPLEIRGRYFSRRSMISTAAACVTGIAMGWFLDHFKGISGFSILFCVVSVFGILDILCFIWVSDPPMEEHTEKVKFFSLFKEALSHPNYRRYIIFWTLYSFSINIAAPFFNMYAIRHLQLSYLQMALYLQIIGNISTILSIGVWGKLIDRYGSKPIMTICCFVVCVLPFMWLFSAPGFYWSIMLVNFLSGIFWSGMDLANMNMTMGLAPDKNRSMYVAIHALITTVIGGAFAFFIGGVLLELIQPFMSSRHITFFGFEVVHYHIIFILSGVLRFLTAFFLLRPVQEENAQTAGYVLGQMKSAVKSMMK